MQENVDKDFVEAGRGTVEGGPGKGGWNMASVSSPRGNSFEEAKLRFQDVEMAMTKKSGTVVGTCILYMYIYAYCMCIAC